LPRFLVLYAMGVSGHRAAALAVETGLRELDPSCRVDVMDSVGSAHPALSKAILATYGIVISRAPGLWAAVHDSEMLPRRVGGLGRLAGKVEARRLSERLEGFGSDCVICTQAFPCATVAQHKESYPRMKLVACVTDFCAHGWWPTEGVDSYAVASELAVEQLASRGVSRDKVHLTGIPIRPRFAHPAAAREEMAAYLGLDRECPTVLVMGGSRGIGRIGEVLAELASNMPGAQVVVVCGTNRELRRELESLEDKPALTHVLGYEERVDALMELADVLITKAGGITTSEALAKRLPMVFLDPIPGQEWGNAAYLTGAGAAFLAKGACDAAGLAREVVENARVAEDMKRSAQSLARPEAARAVASMALELAGGLARETAGELAGG